jgi:hypothetical protein
MSGIKVTYRNRIPEYRENIHAATEARIRALEERRKSIFDAINNPGLSHNLKEISKQQEDQKRLQDEIDLLQTQNAEYAFASIVSWEKQGYQIKETFTQEDMRIVLEKIDDSKNNIVLTVKPPDAEGTSWHEELEMSAIAEDQCFDIVDLYDLDMKELGFTKEKREITRPHTPPGKERKRSGSRTDQGQKIGGNTG